MMGYWEQIGKENRKYREERAAMHPLRRKVQDFLVDAFVVTAGLLCYGSCTYRHCGCCFCGKWQAVNKLTAAPIWPA